MSRRRETLIFATCVGVGLLVWAGLAWELMTEAIDLAVEWPR